MKSLILLRKAFGSLSTTSWHPSVHLHSSAAVLGNAKLTYISSIPTLAVNLPNSSSTQFAISPFTETLGDLIKSIKEEDEKVSTVWFTTSDGVVISRSSPSIMLLKQDFVIAINGEQQHVEAPANADLNIDQIRSTIADSTLQQMKNLNDARPQIELELQKKIANMQLQLEPMDKIVESMEKSAFVVSRNLKWGGLAFMSLQWGFLARLTYYEYSWDIMEPATYFITYGTGIVFYAYYVVTNTNPEYTSMNDRLKTLQLHRRARKQDFDVGRYNELKNDLSEMESLLSRIQDPLPRILRVISKRKENDAQKDSDTSS